MNTSPESATNLLMSYEDGKSFALKGDVVKAREVLGPIVEFNPYHPAAYFLCLVEMKSGNLRNCEKLCETFLSRNTKHPGMRAIAAELHIKKQNYAAAKAEIDIALRANPTHQAAIRASDRLRALMRQQQTKKIVDRLATSGFGGIRKIGRIKNAERLQRIRPLQQWDDDPIEAKVAYFHHCADVHVALSSYVPELIDNAVEFGYCTWPRKIQGLIQGRSVLDVGCGFGGYAIGFLCAGATSYTGIDPAMKLDEKRMRNKRLRQWVPVNMSAREIMELVPAIELRQVSTRDILGEKQFDVICLHNVTEHLLQIESVFEDISKLLVRGGKVVFMHHNFFGWSGHHMQPHHPRLLDEQNPDHLKYCDWNHIKIMDHLPDDHYLNTNLNRIRIDDLKRIVNKHFKIEAWEHKYSSKAVLERLTPEVLESVIRVKSDLTAEELKTNAVYCVAEG